jgi:hypothetical protein
MRHSIDDTPDGLFFIGTRRNILWPNRYNYAGEMGMDHNDRRASSRLTIRDDVTLAVEGVTDNERCVLEDVSMGGIKFFSTRKLTVGKHVELRIPSPGDEPEIVIQAKILRVGPGEHNKPFGYACVIETTVNA